VFGRQKEQDEGTPVKDPRDRSGAAHYGVAPFRSEPQYLKASSKRSEVNTRNTRLRITVAQLAPQRQPRGLKTIISHRIHLPRGSSSLGGT
jgi:hypothetical protein